MTESPPFLKRIPYFTIFWRPHPSLKQKGVLASFIHSILPYLINFNICDVLLNLVPFVQFEKQENTHGGVIFSTKSNTPPWLFFTFFKLYKWYQCNASYIVVTSLMSIRATVLSF